MSDPYTFYVRLTTTTTPPWTTLLTIQATSGLIYQDLVLMILDTLDPDHRLNLDLRPGKGLEWAGPTSRVLATAVGTRRDAPFLFTIVPGRPSPPVPQVVQTVEPRDVAADQLYNGFKRYLMRPDARELIEHQIVDKLSIHPQLEDSPPVADLHIRFLSERTDRKDVLKRHLWFVLYGEMWYVWAAYRRLGTERLKQKLRDLKGPSIGHAIFGIPTADTVTIIFTFFPIYQKYLLSETERQTVLKSTSIYLQSIFNRYMINYGSELRREGEEEEVGKRKERGQEK